jgi:hypothetical protein
MVARFQTLLLRLCLFLTWRPLPGKSLTFSVFRTCTPGGIVYYFWLKILVSLCFPSCYFVSFVEAPDVL